MKVYQLYKKSANKHESNAIQVNSTTAKSSLPPPLRLKNQSSSTLSNEDISEGTYSTKNAKGLPSMLRKGIENLSGYNMGDVKVHYNASQPAQLKAHAFAQGTDIHLAPGQERHLPHEAWHVVQQKQGKVRPNLIESGNPINNETALEQEADIMGKTASDNGYAKNKGLVRHAQPLSTAIQLKPTNPFTRFKNYRKRKEDKKLKGSLEQLDTQTASDVYKATTSGPIGKVGTNEGFAKKAIKMGDQENDTTINLGFKSKDEGILTEAPNLLARQVISSRLNRALGLNVIADEIFSKDENGADIAITGKASGKQLRENQKGEKFKFIRNYADFKDPRIQKGLSDLQLMDALTGQLDRHLGNIFVDNESGKVTGIDNDMAFAKDNPVAMSMNTLNDQFSKDDGKLGYKQELVDESTANKVLAMKEKDFLKVLKGRKGDAEKLDPDAIKFALMRFRAVQAKMLELKENDQLIKNWDNSTHAKAMATGFEGKGTKFETQKNYLARAQGAYDNAGFKSSDDDYKMAPTAPKNEGGKGIDPSIWPAIGSEKKKRSFFKRRK